MGEKNSPRTNVTGLLREWRAGGPNAMAQLMPLVYNELRAIARKQMRGERSGHTLQTTALVHEAYARLVDVEIPLEDRAHFFALASTAMRRVLVDHARSHNRAKRGGGAEALPLDEGLVLSDDPPPELLDLDRALTRLAELDERQARYVEMHFFGGLNYDEIARLEQVSRSTVNRELRVARAYLRSSISGKKSP